MTIPKELCENVGIKPEDRVEIFEHQGKVTVIRKKLDESAGILKHLKGDPALTDEESLEDALDNKQRKKGQAAELIRSVVKKFW